MRRTMLGMFFVGMGMCVGNLVMGADTGGTNLTQGWALIREGTVAQGTIEQDARHPNNGDEHLLHLNVTKTAGPGEGRVGAVNAMLMKVKEGAWYDVTFTGMTEQGSIGLVFSLENAEGRVLARTTLPEIGRGRGRGRPGTTTRAATQPVAWTKYLVSLHANGSDPSVHLVITPIEPTNVWLQGLMIQERVAQ